MRNKLCLLSWVVAFISLIPLSFLQISYFLYNANKDKMNVILFVHSGHAEQLSDKDIVNF